MNINQSQIDEVKASILKIFDEIVIIRRNIHMHPELSQHENNTADLICNKLEKFGVSYTKSTNTNAIVAYINGTKSGKKAIGIRADFDALPIEETTGLEFASTKEGVMHACGHDMHTAILLGTAKILNEHKKSFGGTVKFFFQPSEETIGGAKAMIDEGCLENPKTETVIGLHIEPSLKTGCISLLSGSMNAASTEFYVRINGKSSHGAHPSEGIDPLMISCQIIPAYQSIITRNLEAVDDALITVGQFKCGNKNNIIPEFATFSGIIRALDLDIKDTVKQHIKTLTEGIANTYGATAEIKFVDSYPNLYNNDDLFYTVKNVANMAIGSNNIITNSKISMGADDFSYFTQNAKGFYFNLGIANDNTPIYPLHNCNLNPDEESIKTGILMEVLTTLELLNEAE